MILHAFIHSSNARFKYTAFTKAELIAKAYKLEVFTVLGVIGGLSHYIFNCIISLRISKFNPCM